MRVIILLSALFQLASAAPTYLTGFYTTDYDKLAVCNDGSPGVAYWKEATDPALSNVFVFYLEGGDWCFDEYTCSKRVLGNPQFTSSKSWKMFTKMDGIFDSNPNKNAFHGANKLYIGYCSSDAWVGDAGPTAATFGLHFRGQRIVQAALQALVSDHSLGSSGDHRLLFGGCSAGARGASFTVDYVPAMLESMGVPSGAVKVQAMLDSSLWINYPPYQPAIVSLMCQTQAIATFINATGRLGESCKALYPTEQWKCLFGQYRTPTLSTPYALNEAAFDSFQIDYNMGGSNPRSPGQVAYAEAFGTAMRKEVDTLPAVTQPSSGVFSSSCLHHCVTDEASYHAITVEGISFAQALGWWFFGDSPYPPSQRLQEACTAYRCGRCNDHKYTHKHKGGKTRERAPKPHAWNYGMPPGPAAPMPALCLGGADTSYPEGTDPSTVQPILPLISQSAMASDGGATGAAGGAGGGGGGGGAPVAQTEAGLTETQKGAMAAFVKQQGGQQQLG